MAEASLISLAESLLEKLGSYASEKIKLWWRARDDLNKLLTSIRIIKAGLLDAERRQGSRDREGKLVREWVRRLRNVLYDTDDLFDKVFTIEESKQTLTGSDRRVRELRQFFSKYNHVVLQVEIAWKIREIKEELDGIKSDMDHFKFDRTLVEHNMCYEHESTGPVKAADEVIGRKEEEEELMGLLLDDTSKRAGLADVIAIVGFGGLGKTTLAQLLYNNKVIKENFQLQAWACISDTKGKASKAKIILGALQTTEIITSTKRSYRLTVQGIPVDELEQKIQARVQDKKYLLVVDDYWDEDRNTWLYLAGLLRGGKTGSKILVTTRSSKVAIAMGVDTPHYLKGLADDKAWELFLRLAFRSEADAENQRLIMMGKEIVKKCKNVPLAIKAIASLLFTFCNNEREWKRIMDSDMLTLEQKHENLKILPVLKLSYDHLPSHLKHCFAFCSVFPKDFEMDGESLILHWISQGYVEQGCDRGRSGLMQIGKSYLKELMSRSFLQEVCTPAPWGGYGTYMMHDLLHDLAQEVAGEEVLRVEISENWPNTIESIHKSKNSIHVSKDARIRHLSLFGNQTNDFWLMEGKKYLRSLTLRSKTSRIAFGEFNHLRLLDMSGMSIESLCRSIGELKHLRCLIISMNRFKHLPQAICKLHNLKILDVSMCRELKSLPCNMNRLVNLTCLRVKGCSSLRGMPCKSGTLSSLESLDHFIIREGSSEYGGVEALAELVNLKDERLDAWFEKRRGGMVRADDEKRVDLSSSLVHLDWLVLTWGDDDDDNGRSEWESEGAEFQCSQLPSNIKRLDIRFFPGQTLPEWKVFNNLLEVYLELCRKCRYLPSFGEQPRIKVLDLMEMDELEYVQMEENDEFASETQHFPCLEALRLVGLPKLKAWTPAMRNFARRHISSSPLEAVADAFPRFHSLTCLKIKNCPELMSMPLPPKDMPVCILGALKESFKMLLEANTQRE